MKLVINLKRLKEWVEPQNGRFGDTQVATEVERLDGEGGSQGYLLHSPNLCDSVTHVMFSGRVGTLTVHMPAFQPVLCTLGIHQDHETSGYLPSEYGNLNNHLHDILLMAESAAQVTHFTWKPYCSLGFIINVPKSVTSPTQ